MNSHTCCKFQQTHSKVFFSNVKHLKAIIRNRIHMLHTTWNYFTFITIFITHSIVICFFSFLMPYLFSQQFLKKETLLKQVLCASVLHMCPPQIQAPHALYLSRIQDLGLHNILGHCNRLQYELGDHCYWLSPQGPGWPAGKGMPDSHRDPRGHAPVDIHVGQTDVPPGWAGFMDTLWQQGDATWPGNTALGVKKAASVFRTPAG